MHLCVSAFSPHLELHLEEDSLVQKGLIFLVAAGTLRKDWPGLASTGPPGQLWALLDKRRRGCLWGHGQLQNSLGSVLILWSN